MRSTPVGPAGPGMQRSSEAQLNSQLLESNCIATFVIDREHRVTQWNRALVAISGMSAEAMIGTTDQWRVFYDHPRPCMADLVVDGATLDEVSQHYRNSGRKSALLSAGFEGKGFFPKMGPNGSWLFFTAAPLYGSDGEITGAIETLQDISAQTHYELELTRYRDELELLVEQRTGDLLRVNAELKASNHQLEDANHQLLQSEKMAAIGQLAAGIAHEINNPIGFVNSNLGTLELYVQGLLELIAAHERVAGGVPSDQSSARDEVRAVERRIDLDYLRSDVQALLAESKEGLQRVNQIVRNLKEFSHHGSGQWLPSDLHAGLESTLNIVNSEVKNKARVVREYGQLPQVECLPLEINQVFMNLLVNAAQAISGHGLITLRSGTADRLAWVEIEDSGCGIPDDSLKRIFDPFYTTKPVGQGTGLGLSISYGIVKKHRGRIEVASTLGAGTRFRVWLPIEQPSDAPAPPAAAPAASPTAAPTAAPA